MIKKNVRYLTGAFVVMAMLCGLYGCSSIDGSEDIGQGVIEAEDKKNTEQDSFSETEEITPNEEHNDTEKAASDGNSDAANQIQQNRMRRSQIRRNQIRWNWML